MTTEAIGYWPFWLGGLALAAVPVVHWFLLGRMFAVSGRYTALNDAVRAWFERRAAGHDERTDGSAPSMTEEELAAAMREATAAAFGDAALAESVDVEPPEPPRVQRY